uniref:NADH-ubiquinone oxidoreductase chain 3 n=1 Tax=Asiomorpha coarctata TaxID=1904351 RepID=A0A1S5RS71_9MYRI|nr:NADH dehydrogenase subunit 3 [Asiomorpha coarctata]
MALMTIYIFFVLVVLVLGVLAWYISFSDLCDEESLSSFECGFISFQGSRSSFSLQFFLLAIIFLIFDVEIALILPLPVVTGKTDIVSVGVFIGVFMFVILGGLYYEWWMGVLDWGF